ncbi:LysR substrate-binding domain-containing protein [Ruegeria sp. EL01]|jgi:DNA-binding transcriptional LysR family regulator|uniref:LysR substrate-binding domain-containing protein n=1 Tax=Ruegeria sp. EL01 TaxID=2107578 RepID=UPI000EA7FE91|nr:LysR substrate-binding domain-containing protein [Ruegeria sp. EL01]
MNWRGVDEAVAVAETGSFTVAADMLNTTVASVSRRISELEDRLGVKLFTRTTRQVSLNPDGETYLAHCRDALRMLHAAEDELTDRQAGLTGQIRMTAAVEFGERVIAPAIATFQLLHPEVSIDLDLSNDRFDLIGGKYNLAVRLGEFPDSSLIARKIGERRLLACASPDYLERYGQPDVPADLRNHNCLRGSARQWRFRHNGTPKHQHISGKSRCNSGVAITSMVLRGLGIAQLPDYYVEQYLADGKLVPVLPSFEPEPEGIWIVRPDNRFVPRRVRELIKVLTQEMQTS